MHPAVSRSRALAAGAEGMARHGVNPPGPDRRDSYIPQTDHDGCFRRFPAPMARAKRPAQRERENPDFVFCPATFA